MLTSEFWRVFLNPFAPYIHTTLSFAAFLMAQVSAWGYVVLLSAGCLLTFAAAGCALGLRRDLGGPGVAVMWVLNAMFSLSAELVLIGDDGLVAWPPEARQLAEYGTVVWVLGQTVLAGRANIPVWISYYRQWRDTHGEFRIQGREPMV
uniref:Uncharacterized protein n=2 Tax=Oxyrrhis marina TaxID=2969 RepID=A0A7S4GLZ3_OXYMA